MKKVKSFLGVCAGLLLFANSSLADLTLTPLEHQRGTLDSSERSYTLQASTNLKFIDESTSSALMVIEGSGIIIGKRAPNSVIGKSGVGVEILEGTLRLRSYTTAQRDTLSNPANGDLIYNSTENKLQVYENGAWASQN